MEFERYGKVPAGISEALVKDYEEKRKKEQGR
jgi:elongation factor G